MDRESPVKSDLLGIFAQKPCTDRVEGARPSQRIRKKPRLVRENMGRDALHPAVHLGRRSPRKGQQHHPAGVSALDDEMSHAVGKRVCFPSTRAGDDEERRMVLDAMLDSTSLFWI